MRSCALHAFQALLRCQCSFGPLGVVHEARIAHFMRCCDWQWQIPKRHGDDLRSSGTNSASNWTDSASLLSNAFELSSPWAARAASTCRQKLPVLKFSNAPNTQTKKGEGQEREGEIQRGRRGQEDCGQAELQAEACHSRSSDILAFDLLRAHHCILSLTSDRQQYRATVECSPWFHCSCTCVSMLAVQSTNLAGRLPVDHQLCYVGRPETADIVLRLLFCVNCIPTARHDLTQD